MLLSVSVLLLEDISFNTYPRPLHLFVLVAVPVIEIAGYRQLNSLRRVWGLLL